MDSDWQEQVNQSHPNDSEGQLKIQQPSVNKVGNKPVKASMAAERLGKTSITIRRMIADGRLVGEKKGTRYYVNSTSLSNYETSGDGKIEETEQINVQNDTQTGLINAQSETENGNYVGIKVGEPSKYGCLEGETRKNPLLFYEKCRDFTEDYVSFWYKYYFDLESGKRWDDFSFTKHSSSRVLDIIGDDLRDVLRFYYDNNEILWSWSPCIAQSVIDWRIELNDKNGEMLAYCNPFRLNLDNLEDIYDLIPKGTPLITEFSRIPLQLEQDVDEV